MLCLPGYGIAQDYPGMSERDMQGMMESMQKMQDCMANIDQSRMQALEQRAKQMENEIRSLCDKGERAAAQKRAMAYSREMANDPDLQTMRKCGEMMQGVMPAIPVMEPAEQSETAGGHVCDE